jgi:hypothetical protein
VTTNANRACFPNYSLRLCCQLNLSRTKKMNIASRILLLLAGSGIASGDTAIMDFSSNTIGSSFGAISPTYQPLLAPLGITVGYQNVGLYNGGPDHTAGDVAGADFNTFQRIPSGAYTEPSVTPQIFTFSSAVTIDSVWLSTFQGGLGTINIRAFADEAGTTLLGSVQTVTPLGGSAPIQWQQFTGLSGAPYAGVTRRIEFISSIPITGTSFQSNIQVDDIQVSAVPVPLPPLAVNRPSPRQVIQRDAAGFGTIPISGTFTGTPDFIEARAVVMSGGSNNGTGTDWQTIDSFPSGGLFNSSLPDVAQGGWYEVEVRTVTNGIPDTPVAVQRVGVGDIYITAGQSNAASWGSPAATATDDRVSALHSGTGVWSLATDPMPYADGTGGSPWTRLGDLLAAQNNVPVAFACIALGGTSIAQWHPTTGTLYPRFTAALSRFPVDGFKAVLWHQGETDSQSSTTKAAMISGLQTLIARTRSDDAWNIPWYVSEASYLSTSNLTQEERIASAQRDVAAADAFTFRGSATDDFHLTGKLSDNVHFNAAGLLDHAQQWQRILSGNPSLTVRNPSFNANGNLTDGGIFFYSNTNTASPTVIGWRILNATGDGASGSVAGYFNPDGGFYSGSADSINGGVLPGMDDKHCAYLFDGPAGSQLLQTLEATVQPATTYELTVALGIRASNVFGGARIELLADGQVLGGAVLADKAAVDALRGSDSSSSFTDVTIAIKSPANSAPGRNLAIRLTKIGGAGTYADFDNVRLTATPNLGPVPVLMDFSSNSIGSSFGSISPSYQPLLASTGVSVNYANVGLYDGGPDQTTNDLPGANFNTFQNQPAGGYTEPSLVPQVFTFSAPVSVESLWLSTFQGGLGTINIRAFADEAGTIPLGTVQTVTPLGGSAPIRWQQFTGLSGAPYAGLTRRIEFISSIPITSTSFQSNIQVDDILVTAAVANTPYTDWVIATWGSSNHPDGLPDRDPDGDSVPNGIEYHLGTSPLGPNLPPSPSAVTHSGTDWMRLSFAVDPSVNPSELDVQGTSSLGAWGSVDAILDGSIEVTKTSSLWTIDVDRAFHPMYFLRLSASPAQ